MGHRVAANRLQPRAVGIEGKVAVTQRNLPVKSGPIDIMPRNERVTVYGRQRSGMTSYATNKKND
jgi:hypothetical protein